MCKTSNFDSIYSRSIQVARILQFLGIFCLWSLKNWVGKCPPCLPSSVAPASLYIIENKNDFIYQLLSYLDHILIVATFENFFMIFDPSCGATFAMLAFPRPFGKSRKFVVKFHSLFSGWSAAWLSFFSVKALDVHKNGRNW